MRTTVRDAVEEVLKFYMRDLSLPREEAKNKTIDRFVKKGFEDINVLVYIKSSDTWWRG